MYFIATASSVKHRSTNTKQRVQKSGGHSRGGQAPSEQVSKCHRGWGNGHGEGVLGVYPSGVCPKIRPPTALSRICLFLCNTSAVCIVGSVLNDCAWTLHKWMIIIHATLLYINNGIKITEYALDYFRQRWQTQREVAGYLLAFSTTRALVWKPVRAFSSARIATEPDKKCESSAIWPRT